MRLRPHSSAISYPEIPPGLPDKFSPHLTSWKSAGFYAKIDFEQAEIIAIFVQNFNVSTRLARVGLGRKDCGASNTFSFMVEESSFDFKAGNCFHVCTDGNALQWMFKDDTDFAHGVNRIGICSFLSGAKVISYVLMDNHVHFLLHGPMPSCKDFITRYKHLTGKYIFSRYSIECHLRGLPTRIIPIEDEDNLLAVIAYIDRNPIVAGYRKLPSEYPWGSAQFVFKEDILSGRGNVVEYVCSPPIPLGSISAKEKYEKLGTRTNLPGNWLMNHNGMLLATSFFDASIIESLFKSPARYLYHLSKKLEREIDAAIHKGNKAFIPDKDLRLAVAELSARIFGNSDVRTLNIASRLALARKLRYEYASTHKQIARMLHLDIEVLKGYV